MLAEVRAYALMYKNIEIGKFVEDWSGLGVKLKILINKECNLDLFDFWDLRALQNNREIADKGVRFWISNRCTPITQDGINEKLKAWGLSEYDQLTIMHRTNAINIDDSYWIKFNTKAVFDKNHPRGRNFVKIIGLLNGKEV